MIHHPNQADLLVAISGTSAIISVANVQPLFTMMASLVAIVSGIFAIRYYIKATKKFK